MSLNWNIEKVVDQHAIRTDEQWPITDVLIYATMFVGINHITEDNAGEFFARLNAIERMTGTFTTLKGNPVFLTLEDVKLRIGLTTNASNMTRAQFIKNKITRYMDATAAKA